MNTSAAPIRKTAMVVKPSAFSRVLPPPQSTDSMEQIRKDAEALKLRLQAISKKEIKEAPIRTADLPAKLAKKINEQIGRLAKLADQRREIETEEKTIKADLKTYMAEVNASSIESPEGRFCAEPASAYIAIHEATIKHTSRF